MSASTTTIVIHNLLGRFLAGEAEAKRALVERAYDRLMAVARAQLRNFPRGRDEEESAAFLGAAYRRISRAMDDVRPAGVREFFGLAAPQIRRVLLDLVRQGNRGVNPRPRLVELDLVGPPADESGTSRAMLRADVLAAIDRLPAKEREVVDLMFFGGLTLTEIGELFGVHKDTVKRWWASARVKLVGLLGAYAPAGRAKARREACMA
jgi:RNA polymerase sigma factor (sigma-70 family)